MTKAAGDGRSLGAEPPVRARARPRRDALVLERGGLEILVDEGTYLQVGGADGFAIGFEQLAPQEAGPEGFEIVVRVPDVDAAYARMRALGVAFDAAPADMPWGVRSAWLRDPDGRRVSIYSSPRETPS